MKEPNSDYLLLDEENVKEEMQKWYFIFKIDDSLTEQRKIIDFEREFKSDGLLSTFYKKVKSNIGIDLKAMFKSIININEINHLAQAIEEEFGETKLQDLSGNQFTLKIVSNDQGKSIGFLFGYIQKMMKIFPIKEYSA